MARVHLRAFKSYMDLGTIAKIMWCLYMGRKAEKGQTTSKLLEETT